MRAPSPTLCGTGDWASTFFALLYAQFLMVLDGVVVVAVVVPRTCALLLSSSKQQGMTFAKEESLVKAGRQVGQNCRGTGTERSIRFGEMR